MGETIWANDPGMLGTVYDDLAIFYLTKNRHDEAKPIYERAIAVREKGFGEANPEVAKSLELYAALLRLRQYEQEADAMTARANAIKAMRGNANSPN